MVSNTDNTDIKVAQSLETAVDGNNIAMIYNVSQPWDSKCHVSQIYTHIRLSELS